MAKDALAVVAVVGRVADVTVKADTKTLVGGVRDFEDGKRCRQGVPAGAEKVR